ncbi:MAG: S-methyl-5-thioribose-1-phosphate isomerase [Actinomycetota bacterium]
MRSIEWRDGDIIIIDQTGLPARLEYRTLPDTEAIADAIRRLRVRGAPALGIVGGLGVAQAALRPPTSNPKAVIERAEQAGKVLAGTRPTAVNLSWGIERVLAKGRATPLTAGAIRIAQAMVDEALRIQREDEEACISMAKRALEFFTPRGVVLTHCNTGSLCTAGYGTALGAIRYAHESKLGTVVVATETRPLLQGARLTTWELSQLGIPHALVVDAAAPGLIARGEVSLVIVGADRIAANGDVANKVGTYPLALAANAAGIPFVVVAPTSTIDLDLSHGSKIPVEERPEQEVTSVLGSVQIAPAGTRAVNPAFDLTPAGLVTAIVTERGIARAPYGASLRGLAGSGPKRVPARASRKKAQPAPAPSRGQRGGPKKVAAKKPVRRAARSAKAARPAKPARPAKAARRKAAARRK